MTAFTVYLRISYLLQILLMSQPFSTFCFHWLLVVVSLWSHQELFQDCATAEQETSKGIWYYDKSKSVILEVFQRCGQPVLNFLLWIDSTFFHLFYYLHASFPVFIMTSFQFDTASVLFYLRPVLPLSVQLLFFSLFVTPTASLSSQRLPFSLSLSHLSLSSYRVIFFIRNKYSQLVADAFVQSSSLVFDFVWAELRDEGSIKALT